MARPVALIGMIIFVAILLLLRGYLLTSSPKTPPAVTTSSALPQTQASFGKLTVDLPTEYVPTVPERPWKWIVIHHSSTTTGGAQSMDKDHRAKGWDELGYHFVVGNGTETADGQIEVGSRWIKQRIGAHARTTDNQYNETGIGICVVGNYDLTQPSQQQMQSLADLVAILQQRYNIPSSQVIGHMDIKSTTCPGRNLDLKVIRQMAAN